MNELEIRDIELELPDIEKELRVIIVPVRNTLTILRKKEKPPFISNPTLNEKDAIPIASIHYKLTREKVRLSKRKKPDEDDLDDSDMVRIIRNIRELKEEYDHSLQSFLVDKTFPITPNVRRCVFRTLNHNDIAVNFLSLLRLYNKWTLHSAEYLVDCARCDHDTLKLRKLIHAANPEEKNMLEEAEISVKKEYDYILSNQKRLLSAYVSDLHTDITELNKQCQVIDLLEEVVEQVSNNLS